MKHDSWSCNYGLTDFLADYRGYWCHIRNDLNKNNIEVLFGVKLTTT